MYFSSKFFASAYSSPDKTGDIAIITKELRPMTTGVGEHIQLGRDIYSIGFQSNVSSITQKITILGALLLADYKFLDGTTPNASDVSRGKCICCYYTCIGVLCPVWCCIPVPNP